MSSGRTPRVALLFPSTYLGTYWGALLDALRERCDARLYTGRPWPGLEEEGHEGATVVGSTRRMLDRESGHGGYGSGLMVPSPRIVGELRRFRPSVVFCASFSPWTAAALALAPVMGWQVVVLWEGSTPRVDHRHSPSRTSYRKVLARRAAAIATNSEAGETYLVGHLGVPTAKVHRRPYQLPAPTSWVDAGSSSDRGRPGPLRLLYMGRLEPRKGLRRLFDALGRLERQGVRDWTLTVVGEGEQRSSLRAQAASGGFGDRVTWAGWVAYGDLGTHLGGADVFVFPTLEDTWGMVVLEALSVGLPVVSSMWAGSSDVVRHGQAGVVCDPNDTAQLADHLAELVQDRGRVRELGVAAERVMAHNRPGDGAAFLLDLAERVRAR